MTKKSKIIKSLLAVLIITILSCNSSEKKENKLIGKWHQTVRSDRMEKYEFFDNNKFTWSSVNDKIANSDILTNGTFKLTNDSIYFYIENKPGNIVHKCKITFHSDKKISIVSNDDEMEYEKE